MADPGGGRRRGPPPPIAPCPQEVVLGGGNREGTRRNLHHGGLRPGGEKPRTRPPDDGCGDPPGPTAPELLEQDLRQSLFNLRVSEGIAVFQQDAGKDPLAFQEHGSEFAHDELQDQAGSVQELGRRRSFPKTWARVSLRTGLGEQKLTGPRISSRSITNRTAPRRSSM